MVRTVNLNYTIVLFFFDLFLRFEQDFSLLVVRSDIDFFAFNALPCFPLALQDKESSVDKLFVVELLVELLAATRMKWIRFD